MELFFILLFLAAITYLLVRRSVDGLTTTPVWLLWLVVMMPAIIWGVWLLVMGEDAEIPILLMIIPFIVSPALYFWLIQKGREKSKVDLASSAKKSASEKAETPLLKTELGSQKKVKILSQSEEEKLKTCFPWEVYYLQNVDYGGQAVLCRGKLRTVPEKAYHKIKRNVQEQFGDRFLILFQESFQGEPFFALIPNPEQKKKETKTDDLNKPWLALSLALITLFTTTVIGANLAGLTSEEFQADPSLLRQGLPYSLSLMLILGCHELGHYCTAICYKIKTTLPYFIPVPFFLGTLGAFIQMKSPTPHRKALFDISIAGPVAGFVVTVPLLFWGLSLSEIVPISEDSMLLNVESFDPRSSLLMTLFCKMALGSEFVPETAIHLHSIAIAGYIGVIITALNLMPVGQLDGGHIVHAIYGQRTAVIIGQIARFLMLLLAFMESAFLVWAVILFFMPIIDEPSLNDVTELDNIRDALGFLSLVLLVSILLPVPETLINLLNV